MRAAGERDAFPAGDLGLRHALGRDASGIAAEAWRPYRAYAAMYLWCGAGDADAGSAPAHSRQLA
jgi:AraC family transcriptional regulator of adaptative response / DNA-3-methyladenine glycosylase II